MGWKLDLDVLMCNHYYSYMQEFCSIKVLKDGSTNVINSALYMMFPSQSLSSDKLLQNDSQMKKTWN